MFSRFWNCLLRARTTIPVYLYGQRPQESSCTMATSQPNSVKLFLVGDVMLGRGIDQILPYSCDPIIYEGVCNSAVDYVDLAVGQNGPLPKHREIGYVWGDALEVLEEKKPDVRIINLETSVTTSSTPWPEKGINYRMHPKNVDVIQTAKIDCCVLSNNHVLDWGFKGLEETLDTLKNGNCNYVGAGKNAKEAESPVIFEIPGKGRVIVFACGHISSGVPFQWKATEKRSGINWVDITSSKSVREIAKTVEKIKKPGDIVVYSIHWGGNWGWETPPEQKLFAHGLIDEAMVDVIHGHSSHHVKGFEIYNGKLIIYGCGDFLSDYEGISSIKCEEFHDDRSLMYFPEIDLLTGKLVAMTMVPMELKKLCVNRASPSAVEWLHQTMKKQCGKFGVNVSRDGEELNVEF